MVWSWFFGSRIRWAGPQIQGFSQSLKKVKVSTGIIRYGFLCFLRFKRRLHIFREHPKTHFSLTSKNTCLHFLGISVRSILIDNGGRGSLDWYRRIIGLVLQHS